MLSSETPREPAQQKNPPAGRVGRHRRSIALQQPGPPRGMAFFRPGKLLEDFGPRRVFFRVCKRAVQRNAVLLADKVIFIALKVLGGRLHVWALRQFGSQFSSEL